jgi:hypothetical protein
MPYYINSTPVGRQISLSLKDLDASGSIRDDKVTFDENFPANKTPQLGQALQKECSGETLRSSYQTVDQNEHKYQQNVNMLLNKSCGSKYEEMIKKFLTSRGERGGQGEEGGLETSRSLDGGGNQHHPRTPSSAGKLRGSASASVSLVDSSNKLAERAAARQSRSAILRRSQEQAAAAMNQEVMTEVLSKPLERNKYVPPDRSGTPTNMRGRQRAPPRTMHSKSPINSSNKFKKSAHNYGHSTAVNGNTSLDGGATRSMSVSIEDFNEWIIKNKSWKEKVDIKKEKKQLQQEQQASLSIRSPSLSSGVQVQAERSYARRHSLSRGRSPGPRRPDSGHFHSPAAGGRGGAAGAGAAGAGAGAAGGRGGGQPESQSQDMDLYLEGNGSASMRLGELLDDSQEGRMGIEYSREAAPDQHAEDQNQNQHQSQAEAYEKDVFLRLYDEGKRYNDFNQTMDMHRSSGRFISNEVCRLARDEMFDV